MSDLLGEKRGRDEGLEGLLGGPSPAQHTSTAPTPTAGPASNNAGRPNIFARNRRAVGMLMGGGAGGFVRQAVTASSSTDNNNSANTDLLSHLGLGTSFVQEAADKEHLNRLNTSLSLELHNNSLMTSLFSTGAPQYDPINDSFLAVKSAEKPMLVDEKLLRERLGRLHHPLPTLAGSLLIDEVPPPPIKLHKTPDELKKERQARAAAKREAHQNKLKEGKAVEDQKLRLRNLNDVLKDQYDADAIGTEAKVREQIDERIEKHQKENFERHMAALPHQIEKREDRLLTKAETNVMINIYRIFPIREKASLGMFVEFANDKKLRGFVAWIDQRDAIVVLMGGPAPMRHLDNWLTNRMQWRASADTVCNKTFSTRTHKLDRFSFYEKTRADLAIAKEAKTKQSSGVTSPFSPTSVDAASPAEEGDEGADNDHVEQQRVYLKELKSIALAQEFFFETMPTDGPWPSLSFLWRGAMTAPPTTE